jgi:hypothetical protein
MPPRNDTERLMMSVQGLPAEWFVEKEFLEGGRLRTEWREVYEHHVPTGAAIDEYLHGIQWVVDYYVGKPVDTMWYYPWHLPPLWCHLASATTWKPVLTEASEPLKPQEQLAIVLPMESWHLIRNSALRRAPALLPQFWPRKFGFMSLREVVGCGMRGRYTDSFARRLRFALKT